MTTPALKGGARFISGRPAAAPCGDVVGVHLGLPVDALLEIRLAGRRAHRAVRDACGLRRVERLQGFGNSYLMAAHMRPIGPKPANAGVSWPYGGVRMPVAGSKPPMSNCVPPLTFSVRGYCTSGWSKTGRLKERRALSLLLRAPQES